MRILALTIPLLALAVAGCEGSDAGEYDAETEAETALSEEDVAERIALAQHCAVAHDKVGKFYLTLSEVDDDAEAKAEYRAMAEQRLPVIEAFNDYAQAMKEDYGMSDADFAASEQRANAMIDREFEQRELEDFITLMAQETDRCQERVDAGAFE